MDGSEVLNVEILNAAYKNRMKMLHSYIAPSKKPQTSRVKKGTPLPLSEQENTAAAVNVSALIQQAKNEGREIAHFLMRCSKDFCGTSSDKEVMKIAGVSVMTYYKYKRELKMGEGCPLGYASPADI